jgi:adenine-specific DNA-methyltransferase
MAKKVKPTAINGDAKVVETIHHKDTRVNIPTEELRDFVAEDEATPQTMLYPRDPSLDPQLVWKGKDEQDAAALAVPVVPIYIQEKIHPQAIIDDLPRKEKPVEAQVDLFGDFNGLPADFDQRVDFYKHEGHWSNRMVLGDSLLVMTSLAEKEGLKGKVQTVYFDPPYGIKFGSNWQVSTRKRDVKDGKAEDATRQPEQVRAFRDTWKLGIHSYLSYLRDRLVAARELLTETGSVFVQIGDENVHLVRSVMDEVFGAENICGLIAFQKTGGFAPTLLSSVYDYILWCAKSKEQVKYRKLFRLRPKSMVESGYTWIETTTGERRRLTSQELNGEMPFPEGKRVQTSILVSAGASEQGSLPFTFEGKKY